MSGSKGQEDFTYFEITRPVENNAALKRLLDMVRYLGATILQPELSPAVIESSFGDVEVENNFDVEFGNQPAAMHINGIKSSRLKVYDPENVKLPLLRYKVLSNSKHAAAFRRASQRVIYDLKTPQETAPHDRRKGRPPGELRKRLMQASLRYDVIEGENSYLPPLEWDNVHFVPDHQTGRWELMLLPNPRQGLIKLLLEHAEISFEGYHRYAQEAGILGGAQPINIPIARVPKDLTDAEQDLLLDAVYKEALPVRLTLGSIKRRINDEA